MLSTANTFYRTDLFVSQEKSDTKLLKKGIWIYFLLLIFEGALRKWFLPFLATPLLVIRDPLAIWLLYMGSRKGILSFNIFAFLMLVVGLLSFFATLLVGHGSIPVAVYGARILLVHFPLLFLIGQTFDREDVLKIGKFILYLTPVMTFLIALQFYSPQTAWVNRGVGGDMEGAGFSGALDYFRPPGTFSFTNGTSQYYGFATPFIFFFWIDRNNLSKFLLLVATAALLAAVPLSISRALFFSVAITFLFFVIASLYQPKYMTAMIFAAVGGLVVLAVLSNLSFFQTATEAFTSRFDSANESEGGLHGVLADRYLGGMLGALEYNPISNPFFGLGIGMGTNVGAMLMTGKTHFLISEGEWGRLIGEMGPLLGLLAILIRLAVSCSMAFQAFRKLSFGDILPWLLVSFALLNIPQGQWAQPTNLGFAVFSGGLVLASLRNRPLTKAAPVS